MQLLLQVILRITNNIQYWLIYPKYYQSCHGFIFYSNFSFNRWRFDQKRHQPWNYYARHFLHILWCFYVDFALYLIYFHSQDIFCLSMAVRLINNRSRTIFLTQSQNNVLWIVRAEDLKIVCFFIWLRLFLRWLYRYFFCWQSMSERKCGVKFDNVTHV